MRLTRVPRLRPKVSRIDGLLAIARDLRALLDGRLAPLDVTYAQLAVLRYVNDPIDRYESPLGRPVTAKDLRDWFGYAQRSVTEVVDRLEDRGLVQRVRSTADRRCWFLEVTEPGADLIERAMPVLRRAERDATRDLSNSFNNALEYVISGLRSGIHRARAFDYKKAREP